MGDRHIKSKMKLIGSEATDFSPFSSYVSSVEDVAAGVLRSDENSVQKLDLTDLLDGQAGAMLRENVAQESRRHFGAFFSSSELRTAALNHYPEGTFRVGSILDPAVGAGDLLLEVALNFPVDEDLFMTLRQWGPRLHGRDIEPSFVRLAKARLVLLAVSQGATSNSSVDVTLDEVLPQIEVGDGLGWMSSGLSPGHIIMNPPFNSCIAPDDATWASGKTNKAAVFLVKVVEEALPGTRITAILPDVIRTGSRYDRLRSFLSEHIDISAIEVFGRFDAWTDVDVFILRGVIGDHSQAKSSIAWWRRIDGEKVGDKFEVGVGPVVPHRDLESESKQPYLHARRIPLGGELNVSTAETRGFNARTFSPPFVVVRRTSRPGDKSRGVGTLICGEGDILVENHLIVFKPKKGSLENCQLLINLLESTHAQQWLSDRIRCRHLTVRALREMPWVGS